MVSTPVTGSRADIWPAVDRDPDTNVAVLQGAGRGFSSGGSFELLQDLMDDYAVRLRIMREARDLVFNVINCAKPITSWEGIPKE